MTFTGDFTRVAPITLSLLGCDALVTCSPLVRLGDKGDTVIRVKLHNAPEYVNVADYGLSFEATVGDKLIQDENMTRFRVIDKTTFEYLCADEVHSFIGTVNVAYFVMKKTNKRVTTQNFTLHSLPNAETGTTGLKEHYVSVIDDLIVSNAEAIKKAQEIEDLINKNQVVKKSGDTMTGNLVMDQGVANSVISLRFHELGIPYLSFGINRGEGIYYDQINNSTIFGYDPATKELTFSANTNTVKKTGDTMTGDLRINRGTSSGNRYLRYVTDTEAEYSMGVNNAGNFHLLDVKNGTNIFNYSISRKELDIPVNTTLVKKSEIYTNWVKPDGGCVSASNSDLNNLTTPGVYSGYSLGNSPAGLQGTFYIDVKRHTAGYVKQEATTATIPVIRKFVRELINNTWSPWTELTPNSRDGKATLTPTSEATSSSSTASQMATRRGNTVTVVFDLTRNADSANPVVLNLPEGYRPTDTINLTVFAIDGTPSRLMFRFNGEVHLADNTAKGKRFMVMQTFVVD